MSAEVHSVAFEVVETWTSSVLPSEIVRYELRDILSISEFRAILQVLRRKFLMLPATLESAANTA
jgi:hypothetical protein